MGILQEIRERRLYYDGGCGTYLQGRGLDAGEKPEVWNITHPEEVVSMHAAYLAAGCSIINTNTFGANILTFPHGEAGQGCELSLEAVVRSAVSHVREAIAASGRQDAYCSLDIGPTGRILAPFGDLPFEVAVEIFAQTVRIGVEAGVDLITIETMNDAYEAKAALLAAKENSDLPVFVTNAYDATGRLMTGADPETMVAILEGFGADALGINCSLGPVQMMDIVPRLFAAAHVPLIVTPNAGLPRMEGGKTVYDIDADQFAEAIRAIAERGAAVIGGCCGTTPDYLRAAIAATSDLPLQAPAGADTEIITSYTHAVDLSDVAVEIDTTLDLGTNADFQAAFEDGDTDFLADEAAELDEADAIAISMGDARDCADFLCESISNLQAVCDTPLILLVEDEEARAAVLRTYNGRAGTRLVGQQ